MAPKFKKRKVSNFRKRVRTGRLTLGVRRPTAAPKELSQVQIQGPLDPLAGGGLTPGPVQG
jgi:hypothetical protein